MPAETTLPTFAVSHDQDGTVSAHATIPTAPFKAINWAALFQAVMAAMPSILAVIAAFAGSPTPPPSPSPPPAKN